MCSGKTEYSKRQIKGELGEKEFNATSREVTPEASEVEVALPMLLSLHCLRPSHSSFKSALGDDCIGF